MLEYRQNAGERAEKSEVMVPAQFPGSREECLDGIAHLDVSYRQSISGEPLRVPKNTIEVGQ